MYHVFFTKPQTYRDNEYNIDVQTHQVATAATLGVPPAADTPAAMAAV
jgi:hypothetical protein